MVPSLQMRLDIGLGPDMSEPDYDEKWFASMLDLMAKASEKPVENHEDNIGLLRLLYDSNVEFRRTENLYFLDSGSLVDHYFIKCRYMAAKVGSAKVDIRFLGSIDRDSIDDILSEFELENSTELETEAKKVPRSRMTYLSISTKEGKKEIARVFKGKLSFVHGKLMHDPETYDLGKSLVARIAAESHRKGAIKTASELGYSDYAGPMYLSIPGWFRKNYASDIIDSLHGFFQDNDKEKNVPNPVGYDKISAGEMIKEARMKPGCYYVDEKFKKRHVRYFFMDKRGAVALKLDCNIDMDAIKRRVQKPLKYNFGGRWVSPDQVSESTHRIISEEGHVLHSKVFDGNHLLIGTEYAGLNLSLKGNKIYADGYEKPILKFSEKIVRLRPFADYSPEERKIAVLAANAVYEQMLYKTSSIITLKGTTACLKDDELEVMRDVSIRVNNYLGESGGSKNSYANALRLATIDIIEEAKKRFAAEAIKYHGQEGVANDGA